MKRSLIFLLATSIILSITLFNGAASASSKKDWPKVLSMGSTPVGTSYYNLSIAIADNLRKKLGLKIIVESGSGSAVNYELYRKGQIELSMQNASDTVHWYLGTGRYKDKGKINVRLLATGHIQGFGMWVGEKSSVRSIGDIKGKKCAFVVPAVPIIWASARVIMEPFNLTKKDIRLVKWSGYADLKAFLAEGTAEVFHTPINMGAKAHPRIKEISQTHKIRFLPVPKAAQDAIIKNHPEYSPLLIPAGTYAGQSKDLPEIGIATAVTCKGDLPVDLVYEIVKNTWENLDSLRQVNAGFWAWAKENALRFHGIPYHEGAVKYYKEIGLWTSEMDKIQKQLLLN